MSGPPEIRCSCGRVYSPATLPETCECGVGHFGDWARANRAVATAASVAATRSTRLETCPRCSGCKRIAMRAVDDRGERIEFVECPDCRGRGWRYIRGGA